MKRLIEIYLNLLVESESSEKAKQMGLHHVGFGNYQNKTGDITYRYDNQKKKFVKAGDAKDDDNNEDIIQTKDIADIQSFRRKIVAKTNPKKEFERLNNKLYEDKDYTFFINKEKLNSEQIKLKKDVLFKNDKHKNILQHNARKLISQVSSNLDSGETNLLHEYAANFADNCSNSNISVNSATELLNENIGKLLYQEEESRGRQFGDHGIRHVINDVLYADKFANELNKLLPKDKKMSNRRKLLMNIILLNHDMGYTSEQVRNDPTFKNSPAHPAISTKMFMHELSQGKYKNLNLKRDEIKFITSAIASHDSKIIDWNKNPELSSIRLADNMGLFQKEKLPFLFEKVQNSKEILEKMHKDCKENNGKNHNDLVKELMIGVNKTNLPKQTLHALFRAARETSCFTAKVTLGMWAGEIEKIKFEKNENGKICANVDIKHNEYNKKLQEAGFNLGGNKFKKFAETFGVKNLEDEKKLELKNENGVVLKANIIE